MSEPTFDSVRPDEETALTDALTVDLVTDDPPSDVELGTVNEPINIETTP